MNIIIDTGYGNENLLDISSYMYNRFRELEIPTSLVRSNSTFLSNNERIARINRETNNEDTIIISNNINNAPTTEVVYALRGTNTLPNLILNDLQQNGYDVDLPYQRRLPEDTSKDYYFIHRDTIPKNVLMINYGNVYNPEDLGEAVVEAVINYLNIPYIPNNENGIVVMPGDSLYKLANTYQTSVEELKKLNNLSSDVIYVGQKLLVPSNTLNYTVRKGDTLYKLASKFQTTVDSIKNANGLVNDNLKIGQILKIPVKSYIVRKGDTLYKLANLFGTSVSLLKQKNNLKNDNLYVGQKLVI